MFDFLYTISSYFKPTSNTARIWLAREMQSCLVQAFKQLGAKMKYLIIISFLCLAACGGGSGGGGDSVAKVSIEDSVYGNWIYQTPGSDGQRGAFAAVNKDGTMVAMSYAGVVTDINTNTVVIYYRKSEGTFIRNGDSFELTYSYETCNPVGKETVRIKVNGFDQLLLNIVDSGTILAFNRVPPQSEAINVTMIEDKNCNIL